MTNVSVHNFALTSYDQLGQSYVQLATKPQLLTASVAQPNNSGMPVSAAHHPFGRTLLPTRTITFSEMKCCKCVNSRNIFGELWQSL